MYRDDGSYRSSNLPVWENRYQIRDYGLYRGVIRDIIYVDDDNNDSGGEQDSNEVLYSILVVGGERDGQIFNNARLMKALGGFSNFEETTLKKLEGLTKADPGSLLGKVDPLFRDTSTFNGDSVYFQFLNGIPTLPIIVGMGHHQVAETEADSSEGPRFRKQYNGIYTEINRDGEFTWSKDNGLFSPLAFNADDPSYPLINQFAPTPGQTEAVKLTLGNQYDLALDFLTGLNLSIDGVADEVALTTAAGAAWTLNGITDTFEAATQVGASFKIDGISDTLDLASNAGAAVNINGLTDEINLDLASGTSISMSATSGIELSTSTEESLILSQGTATLKNATGAQLVLDKTGFIKLGNASGDVLKDVLQELIKSMSTATYAGFGAPGSNVADLVLLLTKIALFTGG